MSRSDAHRNGGRFPLIGRRHANSTAAAALTMLAALSVAASDALAEQDDAALARASRCLNCHAIDRKVVGPAFRSVAARYADGNDARRQDVEARLAAKIVHGGAGAWGVVPMPANDVTAAEAQRLAHWVLMQK